MPAGAQVTPDPVAAESAGPKVVGRGVLVRYRVMAFTTATLLIILVFVGIPLQVAAGRPQVVNVVGTMHGFLYIVYLIVAFELTWKLRTPKWQMTLVLLAGTVPFCAFFAERKMTRRFQAVAPDADGSPDHSAARPLREYAASLRRRWLSRRALLLHLEFAVIAAGCLTAGWWQATRALAGNELSWVYSVEWPVFALLAIAGWWQLIHEDPAAYRARKQRWRRDQDQPIARDRPAAMTPEAGGEAAAEGVEGTTARGALALVMLIGLEFVLGIAAVLSLSFDRPSGWLPARGEAVYLVHAVLGVVVALGATALVIHARRLTRIHRIVGWIGLCGVAVAGLGGILTEGQSLVRFLGMALMFVGPIIAVFGYLIPVFLRLQRKGTPSLDGGVAPVRDAG